MSSASLRLAGAMAVVSRVVAESTARGYPPVSVTVLSCSGHQTAAAIMDGCSPVVFPKMAESKARVAVGFKVGGMVARSEAKSGARSEGRSEATSGRLLVIVL